MRTAVFSTKAYDRKFFTDANKTHGHDLVFFDVRLNRETCRLGHDFPAVCAFVNDQLDEEVLTDLAQHGTRLIVLRCAGFNNVDIPAAERLNIMVLRVPAYSPHGVAEHAVALMLALDRKINRAHSRVHEGNFSLDGLLGFEIHGRTVGVIGTGKIGSILARIMNGFGAKLLAYDPYQNPECAAMGVKYVSLAELYRESEIISLHIPLTKDTYHMIDDEAIAQMKPGVMIINTSRGGLIDARAAVNGLKSGRIGFLGLDVYEEEGDVFFEDLSGRVIQDDVLARLLSFSNVIITGHQAFFTREAMSNIAATTLGNITDVERSTPKAEHCVTSQLVKR